MISLHILQESDLEMVRKWRNSPSVSQYMYTDDLIDSAQQSRWFTRIKDDNTCIYKIIRNHDVPVGLISVTNIDRRSNKCFWTFYIGEEEYLGSGIGAKVEYLVLEYVFIELGINKLACEILEANTKVISLHQRFGFKQEAFYYQHVFKGEMYHNVIGMALLKSDWMNKRDYFQKLFKI